METADEIRSAIAARGYVALDTASDLSTFFKLAGFVLPSPYGSAASGLSSIISTLFGGSSQPDFAKLMASLENDLKLFMMTQILNDAASTFNDAADWTSETVNSLASAPSGVDTAMAQLLETLNEGSKIRTALQTLYDTANDLTIDPTTDSDTAREWQFLRERMYMLLAEGVGIYLTKMRLRVQWQAALDTEPNVPTNPNSPLYFYFKEFVSETNYWTGNLAELRQKSYDSRASFVVGSFTIDIMQGKLTQTVNDWFFNIEITDTTSSVPGQTGYGHVINPMTKRDYYLANFFVGQFATEMQPQTDMATGFQAAIADWQAKMPPAPVPAPLTEPMEMRIGG